MDEMHERTDEELKSLEKRLAREYAQASKEMKKKQKDFMADYQKQLKKKKKDLQSGKIDEDEFRDWCKDQALKKRWIDSMTNRLADDLTHVNKIAIDMINDELPTVYAENYNFGTYEVESNTNIDTDFTLYDQDTVKQLAEGYVKPNLDIAKDLRWNTQKINSALVQGILQGESIPQIAKRLSQVAAMSHNAAVRNARTYVTGTENSARIASYDRAEKLGIELKKEWVATIDGRTRMSHRLLDGVAVDVDEKFPNGLMYPADQDGEPAEYYNCRCTLIATFEEVADDVGERWIRGDISYEDWKAGKDLKHRR